MSEFIYIYIYTVIQNVEALLWIVLVIGLIVSLVIYANSAQNTNYTALYPKGKEEHEEMKKKYAALIKRKILIIPITFLMSITMFIPSEGDIKTIIAGGLVWKAGSSVAEIDGVSELPENVVNAMNAFLVGISEEAD